MNRSDSEGPGDAALLLLKSIVEFAAANLANCVRFATARRAEIGSEEGGTEPTIVSAHTVLVTLPMAYGCSHWFATSASSLPGTSVGRSRRTSHWGGGIVGALLAAVPGLLDLLGMHDTRAQRIGKYHLVLNLAIVAVQALSFWALRPNSGGHSRTYGAHE